MLLEDPRQLREAVPAGQRLLGLDVGTKTIGLALSDTRRVIASPLDTIRRRRFRDDSAALFALVERHGVGGLVIGLPLALAGGDTPRTQSVRQFARNLLALRDMPVAFWDERLSTAAVTCEMIAHDMTRKRRAEIVACATFAEARSWLDRNLNGHDVVLNENDLTDLLEQKPRL